MFRSAIRYIFAIAIAITIIPMSLSTISAQGNPSSSDLVLAGWNALTGGDYGSAIAVADQCVSTFKAAAQAAQRKIKGTPPVGAVKPEEAELIHKSAVLNDVAACIFIKGMAYQRMFQIKKAREVYASLTNYRKARVFDPQNSTFWSPYDAGKEQSNSPAMYQPIVKAGWEAIQATNYNFAIAITEECIAGFGTAARRLQDQLRARGAKLPVGVVSSQDADAINKNYLLNDVSACYFIKALSLERSGQTAKARQAYTAILPLTLARIYDPSWNGYWSPAEAAQKWLKENK